MLIRTSDKIKKFYSWKEKYMDGNNHNNFPSVATIAKIRKKLIMLDLTKKI